MQCQCGVWTRKWKSIMTSSELHLAGSEAGLTHMCLAGIKHHDEKGIFILSWNTKIHVKPDTDIPHQTTTLTGTKSPTGAPATMTFTSPMRNVYCIDHPIVRERMSHLRKSATSTKEFTEVLVSHSLAWR